MSGVPVLDADRAYLYRICGEIERECVDGEVAAVAIAVVRPGGSVSSKVAYIPGTRIILLAATMLLQAEVSDAVREVPRSSQCRDAG